MDLLRRLFGLPRGKPEPPPPEHAVVVYLKLSDAKFGTPEDRASIHRLSASLESAINTAAVGDFDGDEFGKGECALFMYGPDADRLFATIEPIVRASRHAQGARAIKRYGPAQDPSSRRVQIDL